jgi:hypothetical protein
VGTPVAGRRSPAPYGLVALLAATVTLPLMSLALRADERFHPYNFGAQWSASPWRVVAYPLSVTPDYLRLGNFRPLGRILEHLNFLVQYQLFLVTNLPMNVVLGLVRIGSAVLLGLTVVWFARRFARSGPTEVTSAGSQARSLGFLVALIYPALLTYTGNLSSLVVFSGLYFQATAIVLLVAGAFLSPTLYGSSGLRGRAVVGFVALGAVTAATNEMVYLAVLVAAAVVIVQAWRFSLTPSALLHTAAWKASIAAAIGFVAVFLPTRLWIWAICRAPDAACYPASEVSFSGWSPGLWGARVVASTPLRTWWTLRGTYELTALVARVLLPLLVVVGAAVIHHRRTVDQRMRSEVADEGAALRGGPRLDATLFGPVVIGAVLVAGAAMLSSLSTVIQESGNPYISWRESPAAFAGLALLLAGLAQLVISKTGWTRSVTAAVIVVASVGVALSFSSNVARQGREASDARNLLADRMAVEAASFDRSPEGDARRCLLLEEFEELHDDPSQLERVQRGLDRTAQQRHGTDFCVGDDGA